MRGCSHQFHAGPKKIFLLLYDRLRGKAERSGGPSSKGERFELLLADSKSGGEFASRRGRDREQGYRCKMVYEKMKDREYHGLALFFLCNV
jgi:hypothetical protein